LYITPKSHANMMKYLYCIPAPCTYPSHKCYGATSCTCETKGELCIGFSKALSVCILSYQISCLIITICYRVITTVIHQYHIILHYIATLFLRNHLSIKRTCTIFWMLWNDIITSVTNIFLFIFVKLQILKADR